MTKIRFISGTLGKVQVPELERSPENTVFLEGALYVDIGLEAAQGLFGSNDQHIQQRGAIGQGDRAGQLIHLFAPGGQFYAARDKVGDGLVFIADGSGDFLHGEPHGGVVDAQQQLPVHRPQGGGHNVGHAGGSEGNLLDFGHAAGAGQQGRYKKDADMLKSFH